MLERIIPSYRYATISLVKNSDTTIMRGIFLKNLQRAVLAPIIHKDNLNIP